jgi:hypothetical protein
MTAGSELSAVRCRSCGGTVRLAAGRAVPTCMFCGADAADLVPAEPPEGIEPPEGAVPFSVDVETAKAAFAKFARSSWWYPSDLRSARLELRALLLPAWAWSGEVETHWTGLVSASTRSGKSPVAGRDALRFDQILVPASRTLRLVELATLGPYDEVALAPFTDAGEAAVELSELTRSAARARAHQEMLARHQANLSAHHGLLKIRASSLVSGLDGRPVLVPVWIGAYRYGRRSYRVLVNGQTGRFVGDAPTSWWKVAAVAALVVTLVVGLVVALVGCLGGGSALAGLAALLFGR